MRKMAGKITDSLLFILAGLLLGIVSLVALPMAAKEKMQKHRPTREAHAFLADKKRALAYYNVLSAVYDVLNPYLYNSSMRGEVAKLVDGKESLRVLDVGCGTGYTTAGILRLDNVCEAVGVDQNHKQLQRAARNLSREKTRVSLSRGDVENLPFRDETFDAVVSAGAVEYFPDPRKALREMNRVLKHQGRLVVAGPEFDWFKKLFLHRVFYTPATAEFKGMFRQVRLQNVKILLTGVDTLLGTSKYVLIVAGTK
jgi:ubiquinone/menaquinone biosynthesis C-methylase UbiE